MKENEKISLKGGKERLVENRSYKLRTGTLTFKLKRSLKNYDRTQAKEAARKQISEEA